VSEYTGTSAAEWLTGSEGDDVMHGLAGDDRLFTLGGNDRVFGDDGNDTLSAGSGSSTLDGGAGNDWADFRGEVTAVRADLEAGQVRTDTGVNALANIEIVNLSYYADTLAGSAGRDIVNGNEGDDVPERRRRQ
jgi:Ca2+-binding RTX toxin-like protein